MLFFPDKPAMFVFQNQNHLQGDTDLIMFQHHLPQAYSQAACWVKLPLRGNLSVFKYAKPFETFSEWWSLACRELGCLHSWNYLYYILAIVVVVVNWGNTSKKHHRLYSFFFFHKFTVFTPLTSWPSDLWKVNCGKFFISRFSDLQFDWRERWNLCYNCFC